MSQGCLSPHQKASEFSFLSEEGGARVTSDLGVTRSKVGENRRAVGNRPYFVVVVGCTKRLVGS